MVNCPTSCVDHLPGVWSCSRAAKWLQQTQVGPAVSLALHGTVRPTHRVYKINQARRIGCSPLLCFCTSSTSVVRLCAANIRCQTHIGNLFECIFWVTDVISVYRRNSIIHLYTIHGFHGVRTRHLSARSCPQVIDSDRKWFYLCLYSCIYKYICQIAMPAWRKVHSGGWTITNPY